MSLLGVMRGVVSSVRGGTSAAPAASLPGPGPEALTAVLGYLKPKDVSQIEEAYEVARAAHSGQYRQSGEPYITHPLAVAKILAEWHLDPQALMAALLHDVVEDTPHTLEEVRRQFPERTVELVHLLTHWWPDDAPPDVKEREKPNYFAAILRDPEAVDLKLLDRADNLNDMVKIRDRAQRWAEKYYRSSVNDLGPLYEASKNERVRSIYSRALTLLRDAL